jgi:hypothetical protein
MISVIAFRWIRSRSHFSSGLADKLFALGIDDVNFDGLILQESMNAMYRLDEVVELVADAEKDGFVTMPLKVTARARDHRLGRKILKFPVREIDDRLLTFIQVL